MPIRVARAPTTGVEDAKLTQKEEEFRRGMKSSLARTILVIVEDKLNPTSRQIFKILLGLDVDHATSEEGLVNFARVDVKLLG